MNYWWVNQNQTHEKEIPGGYLWSPKRKANDHKNQYYENMREVAPGDRVFSFHGTRVRAVGTARSYCYESPKPAEFAETGAGWSTIGWRVNVDFVPLAHPIRPKDMMDRLGPVLPEKYAPLAADGDGYQHVYLAHVPPPMAAVLLDAIRAAGDVIPETPIAPTDMTEDTHAMADLEDRQEADVQASAAIPVTEKQQIVLSRRGQGRFRTAIVERFCRVTGLRDESFLIASHIKPWRYATNQERLDGENGLLLAPHVDLLFDRGFTSFSDDGALILSPVLPKHVLETLRIDPSAVSRQPLRPQQRQYMAYHRERILLKVAKDD